MLVHHDEEQGDVRLLFRFEAEAVGTTHLLLSATNDAGATSTTSWLIEILPEKKCAQAATSTSTSTPTAEWSECHADISETTVCNQVSSQNYTFEWFDPPLWQTPCMSTSRLQWRACAQLNPCHAAELTPIPAQEMQAPPLGAQDRLVDLPLELLGNRASIGENASATVTVTFTMFLLSHAF
jgi:hypothetical protein